MIKTNLLVEKTKDSAEVFNGKLLHVFSDIAELPNGESSTREWIKHPGACAIVPIFTNGDVLMINQFRYPMKQLFLEIPAGKIDVGESQDETATRELLEETGLIAKNMHYVGHFYPAIGYADEVIHIYVALDLEQTEMQTDVDEFVLSERLPFKKTLEMIDSGEINDGKTIVCLHRVNGWLRQHSLSFG
tara:strand:+ start:6351 stop:6917 length:567 start_codon:yes stop_codon:yes gene_type:complete